MPKGFDTEVISLGLGIALDLDVAYIVKDEEGNIIAVCSTVEEVHVIIEENKGKKLTWERVKPIDELYKDKEE